MGIESVVLVGGMRRSGDHPLEAGDRKGFEGTARARLGVRDAGAKSGVVADGLAQHLEQTPAEIA